MSACASLRLPIAALFTSASTRPNRATASRATRVGGVDVGRGRRPTSPSRGVCARHSASTVSSRSARRATIPTVAPCAASWGASAAPIPDDAPVTRMTEPSRSMRFPSVQRCDARRVVGEREQLVVAGSCRRRPTARPARRRATTRRRRTFSGPRTLPPTSVPVRTPSCGRERAADHVVDAEPRRERDEVAVERRRHDHDAVPLGAVPREPFEHLGPEPLRGPEAVGVGRVPAAATSAAARPAEQPADERFLLGVAVAAARARPPRTAGDASAARRGRTHPVRPRDARNGMSVSRRAMVPSKSKAATALDAPVADAGRSRSQRQAPEDDPRQVAQHRHHDSAAGRCPHGVGAAARVR